MLHLSKSNLDEALLWGCLELGRGAGNLLRRAYTLCRILE